MQADLIRARKYYIYKQKHLGEAFDHLVIFVNDVDR